MIDKLLLLLCDPRGRGWACGEPAQAWFEPRRSDAAGRDAASPRLHEQAVAGDNGTHSKLKTQGPVRTIESAGAGLATEVWQRASPSQRFAYTARSCWMHAGPPCCTAPTGFFAVSDAMDRSTAPLVHPRHHPLHLHSYAATKRQFILHAHGRARGGQADAHFQGGEWVCGGGCECRWCSLSAVLPASQIFSF